MQRLVIMMTNEHSEIMELASNVYIHTIVEVHVKIEIYGVIVVL